MSTGWDEEALDTSVGLIDWWFPAAQVRWHRLPAVDGQRHICVRAGLVLSLDSDARVRRLFDSFVAAVQLTADGLKKAVDLLIYAKLDPTQVIRFERLSLTVRVAQMQETERTDLLELPMWPELHAVGRARADLNSAWLSQINEGLPRIDTLLITLGLGRWPWLAADLIDLASRRVIQQILGESEPRPAKYGLLMPPRPREAIVIVEESGVRETTRERALAAIAQLTEMVQRLDEPFRQAGTRPLHPGDLEALVDLGHIMYCHRSLKMSPGEIARRLDVVTAGRRAARTSSAQARIRADLKRAATLLDMDPASNPSIAIFGKPTEAKIPA